MTLPRHLALLVLCTVGLFLPVPVWAADWPMWRYDAARTGASPQELPKQLHLQWVRQLPPLKPAWPDQAKMQFDAAYEPIVVGQTMYVGSSREDCVIALDTVSGTEKWRFFTNGPVRFAPLAWEGRIYATSDDGYLYCLDAAKGALLWKFRGGPSERHILGNERLISTWPARGAPVVADSSSTDGTVYFAASIWPFMGIFIHALDARTGEVRWTNDGDGATYMKQPHNADAFAGVAPQGPMAVIGDTLLIPGGRSVPACYDRRTGKLLRFQLAENGKKGGGYEVAAAGSLFFNGGAAFDLETEKHLALIGWPVVVTPNVVYAFQKGAVRAFDLKNRAKKNTALDGKGKTTATARWSPDELAAHEIKGVEAMIKAGSRLYVAAAREIVALRFDLGQGSATVTWKTEVGGAVARLVAADDRLFAVTYEGRIYTFGGVEPAQVRIQGGIFAGDPSADVWSARARKILRTTGVRDGYCIAWGVGSGQLIAELARQSHLHVIAVEVDAKKVQTVREQLVALGLYGERVAVVHAADPARFEFPPYLARLIVSESLADAGIKCDDAFVGRAFQALRPYGGVACLPGDGNAFTVLQRAAKNLANADVRAVGDLVLLTRQGALPGSANWTHEHGDASNTRVSKDQIVKAPLGLLWFGGPSHEGILPRHGHGPQPQVIDGRLIIEGVDLLRALDIYSGRLLWEAKLPGVGSFYNNLVHQPGANASGTNFISTPDGIYVAYRHACLRLDLDTGEQLNEFKLPILAGMKEHPKWGYLNVQGNYLVGGAEPIFDPKFLPKLPPGAGDDPDPTEKKKDDSLTKLLKFLRANNDNHSASKHLVVLDRRTGQVQWTATARHWFRHNATCVGGGRLYSIDRLSGPQLRTLQGKGQEPAPNRLVVFDLKSGKELWSTATDVFGTWLSYSEKHDVLVEAGRVARDTLADEPKGMRAYRAGDGKALWQHDTYAGPAMLHGDTILKDTSACDLLTGAPKMRPDPLTGAPVPWQWTRNYGCNTPAASEHLLTFRSGAAGFFDLCGDGGTGNFGGFRSSCTNNLIVAGGILTAPEYTRTCTCLYQNQTSLALVPTPDVEMWTFFGIKAVKGPIQRVGINFGAPGDRRADDGTLWLEYPSVGGASPVIDIQTTPDKPTSFRRHASQVRGAYNWVAASGIQGVSSVRIALSDEKMAPRKFTVRLYFAEPEWLDAGQRVFDVSLQDREVVGGLDICKEAGGPQRTLIKEFKHVEASQHLTVRFTAIRGTPLLCGLEAVEEGK